MVEEEESKPSECTNYALLFRFVSQRTPSCAEFALVVLGSLVVGEGCIVVPLEADAHTFALVVLGSLGPWVLGGGAGFRFVFAAHALLR